MITIMFNSVLSNMCNSNCNSIINILLTIIKTKNQHDSFHPLSKIILFPIFYT